MSAENTTAPVLTPILQLTPAAAEQVRHLKQKEGREPGQLLRVFVESGGCSGMQYGLEFDEPREGDQVLACHGVEVLVDENSEPYLRGTVVDFKDDLNDSGWKISNPNAKQSCGCGRSFET